MSYAEEWADAILAAGDRDQIVRLIKCDCVPAIVSSRSCRKCGRRAVITQEHFMNIVREINAQRGSAKASALASVSVTEQGETE